MFRIFVVRDAGADGERGVEIGARDLYLLLRGEVSLVGLPQALVVGGDALLKLIELRVVINLPPFSLEHSIGRRCRLPAAAVGIRWRNQHRGRTGFLVDRWRGVGGSAVIGADRLAACNQTKRSQSSER